jgi:serine/threonine protein kinase
MAPADIWALGCIIYKMFVGKTHRITYKKYTGELMYNILMEKHYVITVNNMKVETLNPNHIVATLYRDKHSEKDKKKLILQITEQSINYENFKSIKLKNMRHNFTQRNLDIVRHNSAYQTKKNYMSILPRSSNTRDVPSACPPNRTPIRFMTMRYPRTFKMHNNRNRFTRRL